MTTSPNDWHLRRSTPDDLPAVLQLYDDAIVWLNARGITEQWGTTPVSSRLHLVEEITGYLEYGMVAAGVGIQGFIAVGLTAPDEFASHIQAPSLSDGGYVETLVARRTPAAHGAGADLLRWAERHTLGEGKAYLRLSCWAGNPKLISYYESRGFTRCGEADDEGWHGQLFEKHLPRVET